MQRNWMRWLVALMIMGSMQQGVALENGAIQNWLGSWFKKTPPANIHVLIVHDMPGVVLEVKGKYKLYDPHMETFLTTRFMGKRNFVQTLRGGLKWGEEFPGMHQLKIVPADNKTTILVDGVEYKGNIYIYDIGGTISIVNELPLEDYLKALLIPQFERKSSREVAAALAISARTNAWYHMQNRKNNFWAVDGTKVGYQGSAGLAHDNGLTKAIEDTNNMILVKDGTAFPAVWTTETAQASQKPILSRISVAEAEQLADKGDHAAQILLKAFPGSTVWLIDKLQ